MIDRCDALVGDVSSVTLDFRYRRPHAPIFLTDRCDDRDRLLAGHRRVTTGDVDVHGWRAQPPPAATAGW